MTPTEDNSIQEAIFEIRWEFPPEEQRATQDYYIMIGRMYDMLNVNGKYPIYEPLPSVSVPNLFANYIVQHRFRIDKDKWPLIQMGPQIITVNDTLGYNWEDFEPRANQAYETLTKIYTETGYHLKINNLILRYINAIPFNFKEKKSLRFLKTEMKTTVNFDPKLFETTTVEKIPQNFNCRFSFRTLEPEGALNFGFYRGKINKADALIWETIVESGLDDLPASLDIKLWLGSAHELAKKWYETLKGTSVEV
jgi:uncharacterized protein (TIGR04255 family)